MLNMRVAAAAVARLLLIVFLAPAVQAQVRDDVPQILVDGVSISGYRVPLFHAPDAGTVIVKTVERLSASSSEVYHFDMCKVDYRGWQILQRPNQVDQFINSEAAICTRINDTVFAEEDMWAKLELNRTFELQFDKQINAVTTAAANKNAVIVADIQQIVGIGSFLAVGVGILHNLTKHEAGKPHTARSPWLASKPAIFLNGIALGSGAALISTAIHASQIYAKYAAKRYKPTLQVDPSLETNDPFIYAAIELPAGMKAIHAVEAISSGIDKATQRVAHRSKLQRAAGF